MSHAQLHYDSYCRLLWASYWLLLCTVLDIAAAFDTIHNDRRVAVGLIFLLDNA